MKIRLDQALVEIGLAPSRERAQALIRAGVVVVGDHRIDKPGHKVDPAAEIRLKGEVCPYVSRGGLKLQSALDAFGIKELGGAVALDIGASTGGFSDCLLQRGASRVWAVDTGRGQLHEKLRQDGRVTLHEQANARQLTTEWTGGKPVDVVVIDVSFISLRLIFPPLVSVVAPGGWVLALVKPQFEAGRDQVGKGGVVRDPAIHRRVLTEFADFVQSEGWRILGISRAEPPGPAGNREFFFWLDRGSGRAALAREAIQLAIDAALSYHVKL
ncbi:TlyA family RNA methyltransferase [bacterium]|nr:TlyA family RNA methyltransferase [bacterium]